MTKLEVVAKHYYSKITQEDSIDEDIWIEGFKKGVEIASKAVIGEFSNVTEAWIANKMLQKISNSNDNYVLPHYPV